MSLVERIEPQLRRLEARQQSLDEEISNPEVASDPHRLAALLKERGGLEAVVGAYREWLQVREEIASSEGESASATDPDMKAYCDEVVGELRERIPVLEQKLLAEFVTDEDELVDALILEIRAGTGGDEASLWAADLLRMYQRYCERHRLKTEMLTESFSGVSGIKEAILSVRGKGSYAALRFESGGHRVQRVPTTESAGRIHTSAATVAVLPQPTEVEVEVREEDLKIDTYSASGPGGQKVNKTASAVRVTHLPTGVVVTCQDEKSQHKNRSRAMQVMRTRLYDLERQRAHDERSTQRRSLIGSGDRSQRIRTYNFPQSRVSDHRINLNVHNLSDVLDGDLEAIIQSLTEYEREQRLQALAERGP